MAYQTESNPRPLHCERKSDESEATTDKGVASIDIPACSNACSNLEDLAKIVAAWPSLLLADVVNAAFLGLAFIAATRGALSTGAGSFFLPARAGRFQNLNSFTRTNER